MKKNIRILVVDDEPKITEVVHAYLESRGYTVCTADTGEGALQQFQRESPHLVILDLMLPDLPGEKVCRNIRCNSAVPIIMLTAKVQESDLVYGLDIGADDYVTKPFSLRALHARVEAVLRRAYPSTPVGNRLVLDGLEIDPGSHLVAKRNEPVSLTPNEFKLLLVMARHPKKVFRREELVSLCLGMEYDGFDRTVDTHIKNLRRKIEDDPQHPRYIQTVFGVGYRFGGEV